VKFAISYNTAYYGVDPDRITAHARHAEECGFEARMRLLTVGLGTLPGEARAVGWTSAPAAAVPTSYFPGGTLTPHERGIQLDLARSTAVEAGRDPEALEYTRWGRSTCRSSGSRRSPRRA
jgi:hypothetical protein